MPYAGRRQCPTAAASSNAPVAAEDLPRQLGDTIRRLRTERGFSQESFAQAARPNRAYMGGVERGQRNVVIVNIAQIAKTLEMSLTEFFFEVEKPGTKDGD